MAAPHVDGQVWNTLYRFLVEGFVSCRLAGYGFMEWDRSKSAGEFVHQVSYDKLMERAR